MCMYIVSVCILIRFSSGCTSVGSAQFMQADGNAGYWTHLLMAKNRVQGANGPLAVCASLTLTSFAHMYICDLFLFASLGSSRHSSQHPTPRNHAYLTFTLSHWHR